MRQRTWRRVLITVIVLGLLTWLAYAIEAGPWRAQVVDAETGAPLEDVVVLAAWYKRYASPGGWAGGGYYASQEVVTGPDGRFKISAQWTLNWLRIFIFSTIEGPEFYIFKPGYGQWRFRGSEAWLKLAYWERDARVKEVWDQFTGAGTVLELPPAKTRKERREFMSDAFPPDIPASKMPRYLEAIDQERIRFGLNPVKEKRMKLEKAEEIAR